VANLLLILLMVQVVGTELLRLSLFLRTFLLSHGNVDSQRLQQVTAMTWPKTNFMATMALTDPHLNLEWKNSVYGVESSMRVCYSVTTWTRSMVEDKPF
jgi:hypothetical protein